MAVGQADDGLVEVNGVRAGAALRARFHFCFWPDDDASIGLADGLVGRGGKSPERAADFAGVEFAKVSDVPDCHSRRRTEAMGDEGAATVAFAGVFRLCG